MVTEIDNYDDEWNILDFGTDNYQKDEGKKTGGNADLDLKFFYRF